MFRLKTFSIHVWKLCALSSSQNFQDVFALNYLELNKMRRGSRFFVEFGAADGVTISNTYLLENNFGYDGVLAEPGKVWHNALVNNRKCKVSICAVWSKSGEILDFRQTSNPLLSVFTDFAGDDVHSLSRQNFEDYKVETISVSDLLNGFNAPHHMALLSMDTEGSEFEILKNFDFKEFKFDLILVEHNNTFKRELLKELLARNGYARINFSERDIEDWYALV